MSTYQSYLPSELFELAERSTDEVRVAVSGDVTGVEFPAPGIMGGALLSTERARRLAAQLLLACDEHDAIQDAAFGLSDDKPKVSLGDVLSKGAFGLHDADPGTKDEPMKGKRDAEEVLATGIARLSLALVSADTLVEQDAPHAAFRTLHDAIDDLISGCAR